ncbi:MAG TPA: type II toxin-antitoxin system HicB family antitoxin [Thermoanaerobaculia bacterium]
MKYRVVLHPSDEGFAVSCPGLPGCWSQGVTEEEALANIRDAIGDYLAAVEESLDSKLVREVEVAV